MFAFICVLVIFLLLKNKNRKEKEKKNNNSRSFFKWSKSSSCWLHNTTEKLAWWCWLNYDDADHRKCWQFYPLLTHYNRMEHVFGYIPFRLWAICLCISLPNIMWYNFCQLIFFFCIRGWETKIWSQSKTLSERWNTLEIRKCFITMWCFTPPRICFFKGAAHKKGNIQLT